MAPRNRRDRILRASLIALLLGALALFLAFDELVVRGGSMEPLLRGDGDAADRVLVFRPYYRLFEPRRFDLVVFERPEVEADASLSGEPSAGRLFVKRVAGMPGEHVLIRDGDVYVRSNAEGSEFEIVRKPYAVFSRIMTVRESLTPADEIWDLPATASWSGSELLVDGSAGAATLYAAESVFLEDGDGGGGIARDLGILFGLRFGEGDPRVRAVLQEDGDSFALDVFGRRLRLLRTRGPAAPEEVAAAEIEPPDRGSTVALEFYNVDDQLVVVVDGRVRLLVAYEGNTEVLGMRRNAPVLEVDGGSVAISDLRLAVDVHYTDDGEQGVVGPYHVPEGEYYVLGDNSPKSRDSRHFGSVPRGRIRGRPVWIWRPVDRRGRL